MVKPPTPPALPLWSSLVRYYLSCLERERELCVRVPADPRAAVILDRIDEHLISRKASTTILSEPHHIQPILAYLNRRGRGIGGTFVYGYPLVRVEGGLMPLCYTEVRLEPGSAPQTVLLTRGNAELLVNRHLLVHAAGLTESEVNDLLLALRSPRARSPQEAAEGFLLEVDLLDQAVLFASEAAPAAPGPGRELQLMEQLRKERLTEALRIFIGEQGAPAPKPVEDSIALLPADRAQAAVLAARRAPFLVVTGPAGSGKSQTAVNLIASAVADGQRVLYIGKDLPGLTDAFPGVLRIGGRQAWADSLQHARQVIQEIREAPPPGDELTRLAAESRQLARTAGEQEGYIRSAQLLAELEGELAVLNRHLSQAMRSHPHRSWVDSLVARLSPEALGQFGPDQLVGVRQLTVKALGWELEGGSLGGMLRDRARTGQIKAALRQLGVPEACHPDGDLQAQIAGLARLEQSYPLLMTLARQAHVQAELARIRSHAGAAESLAAAMQTRCAVDRKRLQGVWLALCDKVRAGCDSLESFVNEELRSLESSSASRRSALRRQRFPELLEAFPVVISPGFAVSGILPNEPELFDLLVVDDAERADIPSFLPVLYRAKRAVIIGDEQGMRRQTHLGEEEDSRLLGLVTGRNLAPFAYASVTVLDRAVQVVGREQVRRLDRQYGVLPAVAGWAGEPFYAGVVRPAGKPDADSFILADVPEGQTIYPAPEAISQAQNPLEARQVARLITQYIARGITDLAVLTPFRGQALLLESLLTRLSEVEPDRQRAAALRQVAVATPWSAAGPRRPVTILSLVAAAGATPETLRWLEQRREALLWMLCQASQQVVIACRRSTLEAAGGSLASLVVHADRLSGKGAASTPIPPGLQPQRLGLLPREAGQLRDWLCPADAVAEGFREHERELHSRLAELLRGRPVLLAPRLSLAMAVEPEVLDRLSAAEREAAAEERPLLTLIHARTLLPLAAVSLEAEGSDRLQALCRQANLPLVRVTPGDWQALSALLPLVPAQ